MSFLTRVSDHFVNTVSPTFQRKWDNPLIDKVIKIAFALLVLATFVFIGLYSALRGIKKSYGTLETGYSLSFGSEATKKLAKKPDLIKAFFGKIMIGDSNPLSLTMKGMALIASYLRSKHRLENLYVVEGKESLNSLIGKMIQKGENLKFAVIVPYYAILDKAQRGVAPWQHKICLGFEIKDNCINLYNFDSSPEIHYHNKVLKSFRSKINSKPLNHYLIKVKRSASYGCSVFALKDAVNFLKTQNFEVNIKTSEGRISQIPPEFMKGCQSLSKITEYLRDNPNEELSLKVRKHKRKVRGKWQNHYLTHRIQKYQNLVLDLLKKLKPNELERIIHDTFIEEPSVVRTIPA
jgi:hypothetical protein